MPSGSIPDLETDSISFLGHYKVSDSEISGSFDPTEMQFETDTNARLQPQRTDVYDNGIEMKFDDTLVNNTITLRAGNQNHKWVTAHIKDYTSDGGGEFTQDGTDITDVSKFSYQRNSKSNLEGEYDLMPWTDYRNGYDSSQNSLFSVIKEGLLSSNFWDRSNLKLENSGIYNYSVSNNNQKTSIFGSHRGSNRRGKTYGFSYTDNTTIHRAYLVGSARNYEYDDLRLYMNGEQAYNFYHTNNNTTSYFTNDITKIVQTNKQFELDIRISDAFDMTGISIYFIVLWS